MYSPIKPRKIICMPPINKVVANKLIQPGTKITSNIQRYIRYNNKDPLKTRFFDIYIRCRKDTKIKPLNK